MIFCPDCNGLGYPPIVEIVSEYYIHLLPDVLPRNPVTTVHGWLAFGTPVPVVDGYGEERQGEEVIAIYEAEAWHYKAGECDEYAGNDITAAVAGTLVPGGVAYPVTVAT